MKRVLIVYYSQSGDVARMAEAFAAPLRAAGAELVWEKIEPVAEYPWPWRNVFRFFDVMPECVTELPPAIVPPKFSPHDRFDLVILAYQVWFLSPSLPIQGFLRSEHARVLRGRKVITICVSRNMWHRASERMKAVLAEAGAMHVDNVVVTHQGAPSVTFITTPRALLTGKRGRLGGVLPKAGVHEAQQDRMGLLGETVARQLDTLDDPAAGPLLRGMGAVEVNRRYVVPERVGWRCFRIWARVIRWLGRFGRPLRSVGIFLFVHFLLLLIVLGIPLAMLMMPVTYPFVRKGLEREITRLKEPSGD
jgi:hypothetical protein